MKDLATLIVFLSLLGYYGLWRRIGKARDQILARLSALEETLETLEEKLAALDE